MSPLDAVEKNILRAPINLIAKKGKRTLYNSAYQHAKRKDLLKPEIPRLIKHKKLLENFDDVREVLNDPRNDDQRMAIRPIPEPQSNFLPANQIDANFIILQTAEQRKLMANSTVVNIDQNEEVSPEGVPRTLTMSSKYKGNIQIFFFVVFVCLFSLIIPKKF